MPKLTVLFDTDASELEYRLDNIWTIIPVGGSVSDGDYGDIVVSSLGAVWTIDSNVVSNSKFRQSVANSVVGRATNSTGNVADIVAGSSGDVFRLSGTTLGFGAIPESSVTGLVSDLAAKVPGTRVLNATAPVRIDAGASADLSVDRTLSVSAATTSAVGVVQLEASSSDTSSSHVVTANDTRLSDARTPSGTIGGDLVGSTWPTLTISSTIITTAARTVLDDATVAAMLATLGGVPTTRTVSTTAPLTGGGALSANLTLAVSTMVASGASHAGGITPDTPASAGTAKFLREDATWAGLVGTTAAVYTDDLPAAGVTYDTTSEDFQATQANTQWTSAFDIGAVGVTKTITARGLEITIPSGAASTKIAGYYNASTPTGWGSSGLAIAARVCMHGGLSATGAGGVALIEGTTSTSDIYFAGYLSTTGANQYSAEVGTLTAYNAGALTGIFGSVSGPAPELYVVFLVSAAFHVTTYIGATQDTLTLADLDRSLGWSSAARICMLGWGLNRKIKFTFPYVRIIANTYPGATYDFAPRISGARYFAL